MTVKIHHLDTNHHVNNQQFINIAMDYLPEDFVTGQIRAEYKRQAFLDDVLVPSVTAGEGMVIVVLGDGGNRPYATVEFTRK